jgi:hypothetical protein
VETRQRLLERDDALGRLGQAVAGLVHVEA